jgi:D-amino-acid dehydrogenase
MDHVTVVGGGAVGLSTAYFLDRAGFRVTLVERARVGNGASRGNAGEIALDLVAPLPAPGVIGQALRGLPAPDSALYIRPRLDPALLRFVTRFWRFTSPARFSEGARSLAHLAEGSRELFEDVGAAGPTMAKDGIVFAFASAASAQVALRSYRELGGAKVGALLDRADLVALEPALGPAAVAGFHVEDQWWLDPSGFVDELAARLRGRGVEIVEGARVTSIVDGATTAVVRTSTGDLETSAVVVAAGVESRALCRQLGVEINLFPGKGYSFSVQAEPMPRRVVHLGDARVVLTPMADALQVAGTMELDSDTDAFRPRRIKAMVAAAHPYLKSADWHGRTNEWMGSRVLTPDGLPAIGRLPTTRRVILATGHNMLGLMLAPSTGRMVTDILTADTPSEAPRPFDPHRLARPLRRAMTRSYGQVTS